MLAYVASVCMVTCTYLATVIESCTFTRFSDAGSLPQCGLVLLDTAPRGVSGTLCKYKQWLQCSQENCKLWEQHVVALTAGERIGTKVSGLTVEFESKVFWRLDKCSSKCCCYLQ